MSKPLPQTINSLMSALAAGLHAILGDRLVGLYLGGSLAMGDFCEASSDLDFLVVTDGSLSSEDLLAIGMLHAELRANHPFAARLEGDYAPIQTLVPDGTTEPVPGCERGVFLPKVGEIMVTPEILYSMRESGIAIAGPEPRAVLPPVSPEQVRASVRRMLEDGPTACDSAKEAADEILNLCRSLCSLETGRPSTKSEGGAWAFARLDSRWHPFIGRAVAVRRQGFAETADRCLCSAVRELGQLLREEYLQPRGETLKRCGKEPASPNRGASIWVE